MGPHGFEKVCKVVESPDGTASAFNRRSLRYLTTTVSEKKKRKKKFTDSFSRQEYSVSLGEEVDRVLAVV